MGANEKKRNFLKNEIWLLTIGGAFQRANVYKKNASDAEKADFKNKLSRKVSKIASKYNEKVAEDVHLNHIRAIARMRHGALKNGHLNIGVSQKVLNLYLKYLWCLGEIPTPPHFPVDRIVQQELKCTKIISWTKIDTVEDYMDVITKAVEEVPKYKDCQNIAELELIIFERRSSKTE